MMLWVILTILMLVSFAILLLPLLRPETVAPKRMDYDAAIYRDQLAEVERDMVRGFLLPDQAEAARGEIYRRVAVAENLSATLPMASKKLVKSNILFAALLFLLSFGTMLVYDEIGSPDLPAKPFAGRAHDPDILLAGEADKLTAELQQDPDAETYARVGDMNMALRRFDFAIDDYQKAIELNPQDASLWAGLGEVLGMSQGGVIVPQARAAFLKALHLDKRDARARFYLGLAEAQKQKPEHAIAIWRDLEQNSPPNAPWLPTLREHIAKTAAKAGLNPEKITPQPVENVAVPDMATAIMGMNKTDQLRAIHGMVDALAVRLKDNPNDVDGWRKLAQSYRVLGETEKAKAAEAHVDALTQKGSGK